ncbi:hypothetical protein HZA40_04255 [Candidatus Peregrinibacteria bacterium]|nr:hypothetical protein [Candidatus Peregrinibacteria bacterium]
MTEVANNYLPDKIEGGSGNPELVSAQNGPVSRISRFIRSKIEIIAGFILAAGGAGTVLSACAPDTDRPDKPAGIYSTRTGALDLTQVPNIGPGQPVPWSLPGGSASEGGVLNYAEIDGENYLFVGESVAKNKYGGVEYIKCLDMKDCLSADAKIEAVQGLIAAGLPHEIVYDSNEPDKPYDYVPTEGYGAFQDANGSNKLLVKAEAYDVYECGIATNTNAVLEASQCAKLNPPMLGNFSIFRRDKHPYALWDVYRRDLQTGKDTNLKPPLNPNWPECGYGFEGDTNSVNGKMMGVVAVERFKIDLFKPYCRLVWGENWQKINDNPIPLDVLNKGSNNVRNPVLAGNNLFYRYGDQAMYATIPPAPQNPEPDVVDAKAPDSNQPDADTVIFPSDATPDLGPDIPPDEVTPIPEVSPETTTPLDEVTPAPEVAFETTTPPDSDTAPDLGQELPKPQDIGPDTQPDEVTPAPEVSPETTSPLDEVTPAPEISPETTTPPITQKPPSNDGGCSATNKNTDSTGVLSAFALTIAAISAAIHRRKKLALK